MSVITLSKLKSLLEIPTGVTTRDAALQIVVDGVNTEYVELLGFTSAAGLTLQTINEKYDVLEPCVKRICLRSCPVVSVVALTSNGTALVEGTSFYKNSDGLVWLKHGEYFKVGTQKIEVTYTAGYANGVAPTDLCLAAALEAAERSNLAGMAGLREERIGQYAIKTGGLRSGQDDPNREYIRRIRAKYETGKLCLTTGYTVS